MRSVLHKLRGRRAAQVPPDAAPGASVLPGASVSPEVELSEAEPSEVEPSGAEPSGAEPSEADAATAGPDEVGAAVAAARHSAERRHRAREILRAHPILARDLRIGRPDLPRTYNDGGLVDVNHVPADVLARVLGLPPEVADRVVAERDRLGGLSGPDDLLARCGASAEQVDALRDRLVFAGPETDPASS